jgi:hypothetical protein
MTVAHQTAYARIFTQFMFLISELAAIQGAYGLGLLQYMCHITTKQST